MLNDRRQPRSVIAAVHDTRVVLLEQHGQPSCVLRRVGAVWVVVVDALVHAITRKGHCTVRCPRDPHFDLIGTRQHIDADVHGGIVPQRLDQVTGERLG